MFLLSLNVLNSELIPTRESGAISTLIFFLAKTFMKSEIKVVQSHPFKIWKAAETSDTMKQRFFILKQKHNDLGENTHTHTMNVQQITQDSNHGSWKFLYDPQNF